MDLKARVDERKDGTVTITVKLVAVDRESANAIIEALTSHPRTRAIGQMVTDAARSETGLANTPRPRDDIWDGLVVVFGEPTESQRSLRGQIVASLRLAGATRTEITRRAGMWPVHFPDATLTPTALEKFWNQLANPPLRASRAQVDAVLTEDEVRRRFDSG